MKREYICIVSSNNTFDRQYNVTTSSAIKAAKEYGRADRGETVTITTKAGKIVSRASWDIETRQYIRVTI